MEKSEARMLAITGMTCNGCAAAVTRVLSRIPGVASVEVDLAGACASVAGTADARDLLRAVVAAGYGARLL